MSTPEVQWVRSVTGGVDLTFRGADDVLVHEEETDVVVRLSAGMWALLRDSIAPPAMSRAEALKLAREHVEAMSTNARGYQDGVSLSNKVSAVDTFARFLLGEEST